MDIQNPGAKGPGTHHINKGSGRDQGPARKKGQTRYQPAGRKKRTGANRRRPQTRDQDPERSTPGPTNRTRTENQKKPSKPGKNHKKTSPGRSLERNQIRKTPESRAKQEKQPLFRNDIDKPKPLTSGVKKHYLYINKQQTNRQQTSKKR